MSDKYKMMKMSGSGPMIIATQKEEDDFDWYNPVIIYEDDGSYHLGTFIDIADPHSPFLFHNIDFECTPTDELVKTYKEFLSDNIQEIQ
jgi:hypothetical protein